MPDFKTKTKVFKAKIENNVTTFFNLKISLKTKTTIVKKKSFKNTVYLQETTYSKYYKIMLIHNKHSFHLYPKCNKHPLDGTLAMLQ